MITILWRRSFTSHLINSIILTGLEGSITHQCNSPSAGKTKVSVSIVALGCVKGLNSTLICWVRSHLICKPGHIRSSIINSSKPGSCTIHLAPCFHHLHANSLRGQMQGYEQKLLNSCHSVFHRKETGADYFAVFRAGCAIHLYLFSRLSYCWNVLIKENDISICGSCLLLQGWICIVLCYYLHTLISCMLFFCMQEIFFEEYSLCIFLIQ